MKASMSIHFNKDKKNFYRDLTSRLKDTTFTEIQ